MPCGTMIDDILDILDAQNDTEMQLRVWRRLNYEYAELCKEYSWASLRVGTPLTLDFGDSDSTGMWLPSDLIGIDLVIDPDNQIEFWAKDKPDAQLDEWGYRYYTYYPSRADLYAGTDLVLEKGGTTFTSAGLTTAATSVDGEYVTFNDEMGIYRITDDAGPFTFEPTYYGPDQVNKPFSIRSWQLTQKMVIIDAAEDLLYDRDVNVYYWRAPTPLYRKQDVIMLPSVEILKLRVLRSIPESKGKFPVSESVMDSALKKALKQNKKFPRVTSPVDKHFQKFDMANSMFTTR